MGLGSGSKRGPLVSHAFGLDGNNVLHGDPISLGHLRPRRVHAQALVLERNELQEEFLAINAVKVGHVRSRFRLGRVRR